MGLILDSTVFIGGKRRGQTLPEILKRVSSTFRDPEVAIASVTAAELLHGVWRAETPEIRVRREEFVEEILTRVPVCSLTLRVARIVAQIDAKLRSGGITVPTADLWIGATALDLGFSLATANVRHFRQIQNLRLHHLD